MDEKVDNEICKSDESVDLDLLLENLKNNPCFEEAKRFAIAFAGQYKNYQGYYEYFSIRKHEFCGMMLDDIIKLKYRGVLSHFMFVRQKENDELFFHVRGTAIIYLPDVRRGNLSEDTINGLYKEIKTRASKDVKKMFLNDLKEKLKDIYDVSLLKFDLHIKWRLIFRKCWYD